jgi:hypothetical protein
MSTQSYLDNAAALLAKAQAAQQVPSNYADYRSFMTTLFEPSDTVCIAFLLQDGFQHTFMGADQAFRVDTFNRIAEHNQTKSVYVAMNPFKEELRGRTIGRTKDNVSVVKRLYLDADSDATAVWDKIKKSDLLPQPNIVLESSPGKIQFIWNVNGLDRYQAEAMLRAMAKHFGTDTQVVDINRVLRVPAFANLKYSDKPQVKLLELHPGVYDHSEFKFETAPTAPISYEKSPEKARASCELYEEACALAEVESGRPFVKNDGSVNCPIECPNWASHSHQKGRYDAAVWIAPSGAFSFGCFHAHCKELKWQNYYRPFLEQKAKEHGKTLNFGSDATVLIGGVTVGSASSAKPALVDALSWLETSDIAPRPEFPRWIMNGTSLYEGLAKPISDVNSKFPELIWLPAVQVLMNHLHNRVKIHGQRKTNVNMILGIISPPGQFFKSSSCEAGHEYFEHMGLIARLNPTLRNAEEKVAIGSAGSSEGFGLMMDKANGKHAILFNDELAKFLSKAGIENSSLPHDLLTWYESGNFDNPVKNPNSLW